MANVKRPLTPDKARLRLAALCSRGEQCESKLLKKCRDWGLTPQEGKEIVDYLRQHRFVDDSRYAHALARDKNIYNGWGRNKIRMQLFADHIDKGIIAKAIDSLDPDEYEKALLAVARAKAKGMDTSRREDRTKLIRFLMGRGFLWEEIEKVFKRLTKNE